MKSTLIYALLGALVLTGFLSPASATPNVTQRKMPVQPAAMQDVQHACQIQTNITILTEQLNQVLGSIHDQNSADAYAPYAAQIVQKIQLQIWEFNKLPHPNNLTEAERQQLVDYGNANRSRILACCRMAEFHLHRLGAAGYYISPALTSVFMSPTGIGVFANNDHRIKSFGG